MKKSASVLLQSNCIFDGIQDAPFSGHVAIDPQGSILSIGPGDGQDWISQDTKVYSLGKRLVCPGFVDTHCFFTGHAWARTGADLSPACNAEEILSLAKNHAAGLPVGSPLLGHGWDGERIPLPDTAPLENAFGDRPVALFAAGNEICWMNKTAEKVFEFTPEACYSEACWQVLRYILQDTPFITQVFEDYMKLMNSRGITSVKEMGFDDFYGFTDTLAALDTEKKLTLRVHFMSQPVGAPFNLDFGKRMSTQLASPFLRFSGFNRMTDGSISQHEGDLKTPYADRPDIHCAIDIDYVGIREEVLAADKAGFRFSLHAQGDAAIAKVLDIYEDCRRNDAGKLINRHCITDLEFSDPTDIQRMGRLGAIAEIYPQIMSLYTREEKLAVIDAKLGSQRRSGYWNRRAMADEGVVISCGTDLPLLYDNIPESIYHACGALFPEGGEAFEPQNALTAAELLRAWTAGGAYALYQEDSIGTLSLGKRGDIAVLDANLFTLPMESIREAKVCLTLVDGVEVYSTL